MNTFVQLQICDKCRETGSVLPVFLLIVDS